MLGKVVIVPEGRPRRDPDRELRKDLATQWSGLVRPCDNRLARCPIAYDDFPDLRFERPSAGVLRITLDAPGLNAVGPAVHASSPTCGEPSTATRGRGWRSSREPGRGSRPAGASSWSTR